MSKDSLINTHRPSKFSQVIGQDDIVASFKNALEDKVSHSFLFTGPSGVGKTTLARIGAKFLGSANYNVTEIDGATYNGVDDVRNLTEGLKNRPLGGTIKSIIYDECHATSASGWKAFLKSIEEPPSWVYFFFCTTDAAKVPDTIKTRCSCYTLKPVKFTIIMEYLLQIVKAEKFDTPNTIVELCAKNSDGSPRKALSNLAVCYAAKDRQEAARLISDLELEEGGTAFALAKALADGWKWNKIQPLLKSICESEESAETVRHTIRAYFSKVIVGANSEETACKALRILDQLVEPFSSGDGFSPLIVAVGRSLF